MVWSQGSFFADGSHFPMLKKLFGELFWWSSSWDHIPNAEDPGSIPGQGTRSQMLQLKIPHTATKDLVQSNK